MMCLVQPVAAIALLEFDAVAFDAIDGADIHTVARFSPRAVSAVFGTVGRSIVCTAFHRERAYWHNGNSSG
jgi:hypothetical protein